MQNQFGYCRIVSLDLAYYLLATANIRYNNLNGKEDNLTWEEDTGAGDEPAIVLLEEEWNKVI